jgi:hypothetical protein
LSPPPFGRLAEPRSEGYRMCKLVSVSGNILSPPRFYGLFRPPDLDL